MASQRLTIDIRQSVASSVLRHRFAEEVAALVRDRKALADDVYEDVYRKADRERMNALPEGWLPQSPNITAKFGEHSAGYAQLPFDGSLPSGKLHQFQVRAKSHHNGIWRRITEKNKGGCSKAYEPTHKLAKRHEELRTRQITLEQVISESQKQIGAALNGVTTAAALVKAWPEMEPFVKAYLVPAVTNLPSIPTSKLNEIFKLPVKKAA
jgi:hypothetical protein